MYLRRKEAQELLERLHSSSYEEIMEKYKLLSHLMKQDDWSFVIKSHALIEAAVSQAISDNIGDDRLKNFIERLPLSDTQIGKIIVVKELSLLNKRQRKFIRWFSELRNKLAHRIENINLDLNDYLKNLDSGQRKATVETIIWFSEGDPSHVQWEEIAVKAPKIAIHMSVFYILIDCVLTSRQSKGHREINVLAEQCMQSILADDDT